MGAGQLGALRLGDVVEQDGDAAAFGRADAVSGHIVPASQRPGFVAEASRLAGQGDFAVNIKPMRFMSRGQIAHEFAFCVMQPCLSFECGIDFEEAIVHGVVPRIKNHFDDAEAFDHGVENGAIAGFGFA